MNIKSMFGAFTIAACTFFAAPVSALVITNDTDKAICDRCTINSTINVDSHFVVQDVNVLINTLNHTWDADLVISIFAPTGISVLLSNQRGGSGNNFQNTIFDDAASVAIASGSAPFNKTFRPEELLSGFNGLDAFGTWTLRISDMQALDTGTLRSWSLDITPVAPASQVPEPATVSLLGLGLFGFAVSRRKPAKK